MCYYRYHYYSQCSHGELYCFRLCDRSTALVSEPTPTAALKATISEATKDQSRPTSRQNKSRATKTNGHPSSIKPKGNPSSTKTKEVNTGTIHRDPSFTHLHQHQASNSSPHHQAELLRPYSKSSPSINTNKQFTTTSLSMGSNTRMTHSCRITHAGPLGVQPNQFGHEVWGDDVRPLRRLIEASPACHEPRPSLRGGETDTASLHSASTGSSHRTGMNHHAKSNSTPERCDLLQAELDELKAAFQKMKRDHRHASHSERAVIQKPIDVDIADYNPDSGISIVGESAAKRLQKRHEQSSRAPSKHATSETSLAPAFGAESFPLLSEASMLECRGESFDRSEHENCTHGGSYARVVRDSDGSWNEQDTFLVRHRHDHNSPSLDEPDREWIMLENRYSNEQSSYDSIDASPPDIVAGRPPTRRSTLYENGDYGRAYDSYDAPGHPSNPLRPSIIDCAPKLSTAKRIADRHRRKALPEAWVPGRDNNHRGYHTPGNITSHSPSIRATHTGTETLNAPSPRRGSHKARVLTYDDENEQAFVHHYQSTKKLARALTHAKSHGNLVTSSKNTVGRKSTFASPTAASKQRSAMSTKSGSSSSPIKGMDAKLPREEQDQAFRENHASGKKSTARKYADFHSEGTSKFPDFFEEAGPDAHRSLLGRRNTLQEASAPEYITGRYKFPPTLHNHPSSDVLRESMMMDKHLKVRMPCPAPIQARVASPLGTSKIPRPTRKFATPPAMPAANSPPLTVVRLTHKASKLTKQVELDEGTSRVTPPHMTRSIPEQYSGTPTQLGEEIPPTPLTGGRAALLHPIIRRLSSAESQSLIRSRSNTLSSVTTIMSTREIQHGSSNIQARQMIDEAAVSVQPTVHAATSETTTRPLSAPCSPKTQHLTTVVPALETASLLSSNAEDPKHQEQDLTETSPAPISISKHTYLASPVVVQVDDKPHLHEESAALVAKQDPAIVEIGSVMRSSLHAPKMANAFIGRDSIASTLRATASEFVPCSSSAIPTHQLAVITKPTVLDRISERSIITPIEQQAPSLTSPPCTYATAYIPNSGWSALTPDYRQHVLAQRHPRGSSDGSASGLSNLTFGSALSSCQSFSSESPDKPTRHFDWFRAARDGEAVRFARAPLPSMDETEAEDSTSEKGWDIGSAVPGWRAYGWRGGDGLEISFVGHGPDAERFPDAPIEFHNYKKKTASQNKLVSSQQTPTYDRSAQGGRDVPLDGKMKEWATTMGYKHAPCGDFEVTHAIEHVSTRGGRDFIDGWCNNCVSPHC